MKQELFFNVQFFGNKVRISVAEQQRRLEKTVQAFQILGDPPTFGINIFALIGCTTNSKKALTKTVRLNRANIANSSKTKVSGV